MEFYSQILAVLSVLGLMAGCLWLLRRKGLAQFAVPRRPKTSTPRLEVLERVFLTSQHSVHLVRVGRCTLLVGVSPSQCSAIKEFDSSDLQAGRP